MKGDANQYFGEDTDSWRSMITVVPYANEAVEITEEGRYRYTIEVPLKKVDWLIPPFSWMFRPSSFKQYRLDGPGAEVLAMCTGNRSLEAIIDDFSDRHRLTFHEARVSVTLFVKNLVERGIIVLVAPDSKDHGRA